MKSLISFPPLHAQLNYIDNGDFEETKADYGNGEGWGELSKAVGWYDEKDLRGADLWRQGFYIYPYGVDMTNETQGNTYCGFLPAQYCSYNCFGEIAHPWAEMIQKKLKYPIPALSIVRIRYKYAIEDEVGRSVFPNDPRTTYLTGYTSYLTENYTDVLDGPRILGFCGLGCWQQPDHIVTKFPDHIVDRWSVNRSTWYHYTSPYMVVPKQCEWFAMRGLLGVPKYTTDEDQAYQFIDDIVLEAQDWCSHPCFRVEPNEPLQADLLGNVITPNGDGFNDHLRFRVSNAVYAELEIYRTNWTPIQKKASFLVPNGMKDFIVYWDGFNNDNDLVINGFYTYKLKLWRCEDYQNPSPTFEKVGSFEVQNVSESATNTAIWDLNNPPDFVEDCCKNTTEINPFNQGFLTPKCCPETLIVKNLTLSGTKLYKAKQHILVENCTVAADAELTFKAGISIDGVADLEIPAGASVDMLIENPCPSGGKYASPATEATTAHAPEIAPTTHPAYTQAAKTNGATTATLYPNPFKRSTGIALRLADACAVQAVVYDATMRPIATIAEGSILAAGTHTLEWNASHIPAGIYIVRLQAGAFAQTFKVVKVE